MLKPRFQAVVFDFDGTIAKTEPGILNSVRYALKQMGRPIPDRDVLVQFIGPPLYASFETLCGMTPEAAETAVIHYRTYYAAEGLFQCEAYPGIPELLRALRQSGCRAAIASGKPEKPLRRICDHLNLTKDLDAVCGPAPDNHSAKKEAEILRALGARYEAENARAQACMVGDRRFDIESARALHLASVGALYGYGSRDELEKAGADVLCEDVDALFQYLLGQK